MSNAIQWLPILAQLGEEEVARILDRSPDIQTAILEARKNFQQAGDEADELRKLGHEN